MTDVRTLSLEQVFNGIKDGAVTLIEFEGWVDYVNEATYDDGYAMGSSDGYSEGRDDGYEEGYDEGASATDG